MINYIVEAILIEKQHLISVFNADEATPNNVIISSAAAPVKINFGYKACTWYSEEKTASNGRFWEYGIVFGVIKTITDAKKWVLDNNGKEFVAFVRLRNEQTYIVGSNNVGLELRYSLTMSKNRSLIVILSGAVENTPIFSTYSIRDFFVGRDFSDDFNIDFK
jgi:hypothetical protein